MNVHDAARERAQQAAAAVLDASEQSVLGRHLAWQAVNAALDDYADEWALWLLHAQSVGYLVVAPEPTLPVLYPSLRMARAGRKITAQMKGYRRRDLRIIRAVIHQPH